MEVGELPTALQQRIVAAIDAGVGSAIAACAVWPDGRVGGFAWGRTSRVRWCPADTLAAGRHEPWTGSPIDLTTPFDLASLTKPIATTTLLAQLVGSGRLSLDTPLAALLPDAASSPAAQASLRQLLSHTSGWPAWHDYFAETEAVPDGPERAAAVRRLVLATALQRPAASTAGSSDLGFMALGWVVEAVGQHDLATQFARAVAEPLDVALTFAGQANRQIGSCVATEIWAPRCADGLPLLGSVHDDNCAALGGVAGHAGLFGSALDVVKWAQCWLAAVGGAPNRCCLDPGLALDWTTAVAAAGSGWRLGWDTPTGPNSTAGDLAPAGTFGHLGFTGTSVWCSPQQRSLFCLLTNRVHPSRTAVDGIKALRRDLHDGWWRAIRAI